MSTLRSARGWCSGLRRLFALFQFSPPLFVSFVSRCLGGQNCRVAFCNVARCAAIAWFFSRLVRLSSLLMVFAEVHAGTSSLNYDIWWILCPARAGDWLPANSCRNYSCRFVHATGSVVCHAVLLLCFANCFSWTARAELWEAW